MSLLERVSQTLIHRRDSDANDNPLDFRMVQYTDSSGNQSGKFNTQVKLYNPGSAIVKGTVLMVNYTGVPSTSPQVIVTATNTPTREIVVAPAAIATLTWDWFVIGGWCDALIEGTTDVAIGDYLKIVQATSANGFIKDSSTVYSTGTIAVAGVVQTSNAEVLGLVELLGGRAAVA